MKLVCDKCKSSTEFKGYLFQSVKITANNPESFDVIESEDEQQLDTDTLVCCNCSETTKYSDLIEIEACAGCEEYFIKSEMAEVDGKLSCSDCEAKLKDPSSMSPEELIELNKKKDEQMASMQQQLLDMQKQMQELMNNNTQKVEETPQEEPKVETTQEEVPVEAIETNIQPATDDGQVEEQQDEVPVDTLDPETPAIGDEPSSDGGVMYMGAESPF